MILKKNYLMCLRLRSSSFRFISNVERVLASLVPDSQRFVLKFYFSISHLDAQGALQPNRMWQWRPVWVPRPKALVEPLWEGKREAITVHILHTLGLIACSRGINSQRQDDTWLEFSGIECNHRSDKHVDFIWKPQWLWVCTKIVECARVYQCTRIHFSLSLDYCCYSFRNERICFFIIHYSHRECTARGD